jgi:hypothetical protein
MSRQKKFAIEIASEEAQILPNEAIVVRPTRKARRPDMEITVARMMAARIVRTIVDELVVGDEAGLEPFFRSREISDEIRNRQTVFERNKGQYYHKKWGCLKCGRKDTNHMALGLCGDCHRLIGSRFAIIKAGYDRADPNLKIEKQIDRLTAKIRTAKLLLGNE